MAKVTVLQAIMCLIEPALIAEGLELVDVEYKKEGKNWVLRIFIDKEGGVTVTDCQKVSQKIGDLIDVEETITAPYNLEVSSPGLNRTLKREKDFVKFKGREIHLHSLSPVDKRRKFTGILKDFKDQTLYLGLDGKILEIPLRQISKANLVIEI